MYKMIINYDYFKENKGEIITRQNLNNISNLFDFLLNKDILRYSYVNTEVYDELNKSHPLIMDIEMYIQPIIPNEMSIFRAFSNCFYWNKYKKNANIDIRNLGYYSLLQTELSYYLGER